MAKKRLNRWELSTAWALRACPHGGNDPVTMQLDDLRYQLARAYHKGIVRGLEHAKREKKRRGSASRSGESRSTSRRSETRP